MRLKPAFALLAVALVVCLPRVLSAKPSGGGTPTIAQVVLAGQHLSLQPDSDFQRAALEIVGPRA